MSLINLTNENFDAEAVKSDKPVLIDFWAPWCAPCRALGPTIEELARECTDYKICKVNVDEQPEVCTPLHGAQHTLYSYNGKRHRNGYRRRRTQQGIPAGNASKRINPSLQAAAKKLLRLLFTLSFSACGSFPNFTASKYQVDKFSPDTYN